MFKGRSAMSVSILLALTAAVYLRPAIFVEDQALNGVDYFELHIKRIAFAQDALFGPSHFLPRGIPANCSARRLPRTFRVSRDPHPSVAAAPARTPGSTIEVGVLLAALLSALFT